MKPVFFLLLHLISLSVFGQNTYNDSLTTYQQHYVQTHEVVKDADQKAIHFFPVNEKYRVVAQVKIIENSTWFKMETSGAIPQLYRLWGVATFWIDGHKATLNIYQSQRLMQTEEYKNNLFVPVDRIWNYNTLKICSLAFSSSSFIRTTHF